MSKSYLKIVCDAYRDAAKTPLLVSARVEASPTSSNIIPISTRWSQSNLSTNQKVTFNKQVLINASNLSVEHASVGVSESGREMFTARGEGEEEMIAIVRKAEKDDCQNIELWNKVQGMKATFNMKDVDVHGKIYTDSEFGSLELSEDRHSLLYIAEKKKEKNVSYLFQGEVGSNAKIGCEAEYQEDWGEQMVGKANPVIVVLDLQTEQPVTAQVLGGVPDGWSPGLVRWWAGGVVGVAYRTTPRRLGKVYCSNRPSILFHLTLTGEWTVLAGDGDTQLGITKLCVGPGGRLVWLERSLSGTAEPDLYPGPHGAALRVMSLTSLGGEVSQVLSEQQPPYQGGHTTQFCGVFSPSIARRCWLDSDHMIISCPQGETMRPVVIGVSDGSVVVPGDASCQGVVVTDVLGDLIVGVKSDPLTPPYLVAAFLPAGPDLKFSPVSPPPPCPVPDLTWSSLLISPTVGPPLPYTAHYVGPVHSPATPLIVWPHGGPHSVITTDYKTVVMFFCKLGYGVLFVNYRGSTGFGEDNVRSLLGNVGDIDVKDCHLARELCLEMFPHLSREKCLLMGGSHGGFLVTHLAGQYPGEYKV
jgi:acylaminoacyl-peptidase